MGKTDHLPRITNTINHQPQSTTTINHQPQSTTTINHQHRSGWNMPQNTVQTPYMSFLNYETSTSCVAADAVSRYQYLNECTNINGGTSYSINSNGQVLLYGLSGCQGVGLLAATVPLGCTKAVNNVVDDDAPPSASQYVEYVSPAAHWTVNAGLAALLALVACMAI